MWEFNKKVVNEIPERMLNRSSCRWLCRKPRDQQVQGGAPMVLGMGRGGLQEKQNGIDRLSEMMKCLTENYIRKKRKRLINSDLKWTGSGSNVGYRCANACVCRMWVHVRVTHVDEEGHRCRCAYGSLGHRREKQGQRKKEEIMLYSEVLIKISGFFMETSLRWFVYFSVCCKVRGHC